MRNWEPTSHAAPDQSDSSTGPISKAAVASADHAASVPCHFTVHVYDAKATSGLPAKTISELFAD